MRYNLLTLAAMPVVAFLVSADQIPEGTTHDPSWGNAIVENQCEDAVYYMYDNDDKKHSIESSGKMSVPVYKKNHDGGGGSIKLFTDYNTDPWAQPRQAMTQFEFMATDHQYFDVSNVNSNLGEGVNGNGDPCEFFPPFMEGGMRLSAPGLEDIVCPPGTNPCKSVYSEFNDDFATVSTAIGKDMTLVLCPKGSTSSQSGEGSGNGAKGQEQSAASQSPTAESYSTQQQQPQPQEQPAAPQSSVAQSPPAQQQQPPPEKEQPAAPESSAAQSPPTQQQQPPTEAKNMVSPQAEQSGGDVVWVTQIVTAPAEVQTVHVQAREHPQKDKRHDHIHQHVHNKINKRRHGS